MPPGAFIAGVVKLAMVGTAKGDGKLVTDLAAKGLWLGEADVMRVGGKCAAEKTGLRGAPHKRGHLREQLVAHIRWNRSSKSTFCEPTLPRKRDSVQRPP